jgi:iron(III) transport system ATP-binding protein
MSTKGIIMIELSGIEIKYGDFVAINELDLEIKEGEFFTLLGPSGCGKTTLLRAITGFVNPSKGKVFFDGKDVTDVPVEKREVGIVFQSYAIFPTMNVFENIAFGLRVKRLPKAEIKQQVLDIAKMVDLSEEMLQRKATQLSGGQQQRVAIARSLIMKPKILCLDEPLSNLDAKLRHQLRGELKRIQAKFGITTVYVTHDQEEALTLSNRIAVFNHGVLQQVGTPFEIYHSPQTDFVANFIGDINIFKPEEINGIFGQKIINRMDGTCYIKLNSIRTHQKENDLKCVGKVKNIEFSGMFSTIMYDIGSNLSVKTIKIDTLKEIELGEQVDLYLDIDEIIHL